MLVRMLVLTLIRLLLTPACYENWFEVRKAAGEERCRTRPKKKGAHSYRVTSPLQIGYSPLLHRPLSCHMLSTLLCLVWKPFRRDRTNASGRAAVQRLWAFPSRTGKYRSVVSAPYTRSLSTLFCFVA